MAKDVEVICTYCSNKRLFVDYVAMRNTGWNIFGWKIHTYTPYVKCPTCSKKDMNELPTSVNINEESNVTESVKKTKAKRVKSKKEPVVKKKTKKRTKKK